MKEEKFPNSRKSYHQQVCGEFWNLKGNITRRVKKKKKNPQNTLLNATPSGEVAQTLMSATSEQGERWVACLGSGPGLNSLRTI